MRCPRLSPGPKSQVITLTLVLLWTLGLSTVAAAQGQKLLNAFHSPPDGSFPQGGVVADKAGNLYGTTQFGFGTVYELSPPTVSGGAWTETILYIFTGSDGGGPNGNLVRDASGNLYGTADFGGANNKGVIFQLSPPATQGGAWTETTLYNAEYPVGGVTSDQSGNLFFTNSGDGLTLSACGSLGCGSVIELSSQIPR